MAAHLRRTFANDGEELVDVVARHYLDALAAVPDDTDADEIRDEATVTLTRAAERAERTGAPARASVTYATAAELIEPRGESRRTADLWARATSAAVVAGDNLRAIDVTGPAAISRFGQLGDARAVARVQTSLGRALRRSGRHTESREALTAALAVLRTDPDLDTVDALDGLAALENFSAGSGAAAANREAVEMAEGLDAGPSAVASVLIASGIHLSVGSRLVEATMYFEKAAELAAQVDDAETLGYSLLNLANVQIMRDPAAAVATLQRSLPVVRRVGDRGMLGTLTINLAIALVESGDWDQAAQVVAAAAEDPVVGDEIFVLLAAAHLAGLRGHTAAAHEALDRLAAMPDTEDPQNRSAIAAAAALVAVTDGQLRDAVRHGRDALSFRDDVGIGADAMRFAWPVTSRAALDLGDRGAVDELLAILDAELPGRLPPLMRAERDLVRARLAVARGDGGGEQLAAAIATMRQASPPHLLAYGLLDHAAYLSEQGDEAGAAVAVAEAREIGERLGCRPVLDRADRLAPERSSLPSPR